MNCPKCDHYCSNVLESRRRDFAGLDNDRVTPDRLVDRALKPLGVKAIRRRRSCPKCKHRWITYELSVVTLNRLYERQRYA